MLLRLALAREGMQIGDVEVVKMDPSTVVSAFASKQIDGAGIWYPLVGIIKRNVPDMVEVAKSATSTPRTRSRRHSSRATRWWPRIPTSSSA